MSSDGDQKVSKFTIIVLGLYISGIIVGGGILALPFVALDTGWLLLVIFLIALALIFSTVYSRILDAVSIVASKRRIKIGLSVYDQALEESKLAKWGKLAFTIGILLYVYPADIVYILYGFKSIIQLTRYVTVEIIVLLLSSTLILFAFSTYMFKGKYSPIYSLLSKLFFMSFIWILSIYVASLLTDYVSVVLVSATGFTLSLIGGEYIPDKIFGGIKDNEFEDTSIHPRHKTQAVLTVFKLALITIVPILAFIIILQSNHLPSPPSILPRSFVSLIDSFSVIVFMYVGSGVYNILMYKWIVNRTDRGKLISNLGILIALTVYLIFTVVILATIDPVILEESDIRREHAFISLSRKLEHVGMNVLAFAVIGLAALFALVSVSVAYIGFTDTLSERLEIDLGYNRDKIWLAITLTVFISTILLEIFDVTRIATDALGVAGNAGGGLFLLILPWLMKTKKDEGKPFVALLFLGLIIFVNIFMIIGATTIIALIATIISTALVAIIGVKVILEWLKNH